MLNRRPLRRRSRAIVAGTLCLSLLLGAHSSALATNAEPAPNQPTATDSDGAGLSQEPGSTVADPAQGAEPSQGADPAQGAQRSADAQPQDAPAESAEASTPSAPDASAQDDSAEAQSVDEAPAADAGSTSGDSARIPSGTRFFRSTSDELVLKIDIENDGTPGFDTEDGPGKDSNAKNGIVRVNDVVRYKLEYNSAVGAVDDFMAKIVFPKGVYLTDLPAVCQAGSTLTPQDPTTNVTLPLTTNSRDQLQQQTLDCNLGHVEDGSTKVFISAKVSNLVHHDEVLTIQSATSRATNVTETPTTSTLPSVKASAALKWELSVNSMAEPDSRGNIHGYSYGPAYEPCPFDKARDCFVVRYNLTMSAPDGGKGTMPAIGDVTFTDDLSFRSLYPGLDPSVYAKMEADKEKYGARIAPSTGFYAIPGTKIGERSNGSTTNTPANSVRDSGTLTMTQTDGPGTPVSMRISGADFSLHTFPQFAVNPVTTKVPSGRAYAVSVPFNVFYPIDTVREFGKPSGSGKGLDAINMVKNLEVHGFQSTDVQNGDAIEVNDKLTKNLRIASPGGLTKYFGADVGASNNTPANVFANFNGWLGDGPPGGGVHRGGDIGVASKQDVVGIMTIPAASPVFDFVGSYVVCDAWDNTKLHLKEKQWEGARKSSREGVPTGFGRGVPSDGKAVWMTGYSNVLLPSGKNSTDAISTDQVPALTVQYSPTPATSNADVTCGDDKGQWYDSPAAVPGNDAEKAKEGVYTAVGRVRVHFNSPRVVGKFASLGNGYFINLAVGYQIADGLPAGTKIPNWASMKRLISQDDVSLTMPQMLERDDLTWSANVYDPETHNVAPGDRLIASEVFTRVTKKVRKGSTAPFTSTPPQVTGGERVDYEIVPSLSSGSQVPGNLADVWVEDCLPSSSAYLSATKEPEVVRVGSTPDDAKRPQCDPGATYIRWVYHKAEANRAIEPIIVTTEALQTAGDGSYVNHVQVWAEGDASPVAKRVAEANITTSNKVGLKLAKRPLTPLLQVNAQGAPTKEDHIWRIEATNTAAQNSGTINDPVIIDVLPKNGIHGTDSHGTFTFKEIKPVSQDANQWTVEYTSAPTDSIKTNPKDASNQASGTTKWCLAADFGQDGCPAAEADVTGIRVSRPGPMAENGSIVFDVLMTGEGNHDGDVYFNGVGASASNLQTIIGPFYRKEAVYAASIGDRMFIDTDGNGLYAPATDAPVPGATVRLTGTDDLGNPVNLTTTTRDDGMYTFSNLRASNDAGYTVTFEIPQTLAAEKYEFTTTSTSPVAQGVDNDSDADGSGVVTGVVLRPGEDRTDIDAGIVKPSIRLVKLASPTAVTAGDTITYIFTAFNNGRTTLTGVVLEDKAFTNAFNEKLTLSTQPVFNDGNSTGTTARFEPGQHLTWTATYQVQPGDIDLGKTIDNTATVKAKSPRDNEVTTEDSQSVTSVDDGAYKVSKTAAPATGTTIEPGQTVTYTVKVVHTGGIRVGRATFEDDLTDVLANAEYNNDAVVQTTTGETGTLAYDAASKKLQWQGPLAKGQVVTVTYSVTAKADAANGLRNRVTPNGPSGPNPKGSCDDAVGCETTHPFAPGTYHFHKAASVEAKTGTDVVPGDIVNYTVTVKHKDGATVVARVVDDLSGVLDDAELVGTPQASAGSLEPLAGNQLTWTGRLSPNSAPVTITYKVRVKGTGADRQLTNTVTNGGTISGTCEDGQSCTTTHTLTQGTYHYSKSSTPDGYAQPSTTVLSGTPITYRILLSHDAGDTVKGASIEDDLTALMAHTTGTVTNLQWRNLDDAFTERGEASYVEDAVDGKPVKKIVWTGDLLDDQVVEITYTVTVDAAGSATLVNTVTSTEDTPQGATPRHRCDPDPNTQCTTVHRVEGGTYTIAKTSDQVGKTLRAGDTIRYTLTAKHQTGDRVKAAHFTDDLTKHVADGVLTYGGDATATSTIGGTPVEAAAVPQPTANGEVITWEGDLAPTQEVTVTFTATVRKESKAELVNTVTTTDTRGTCETPDGCHVSNTIPDGQFVYSKTAKSAGADTPAQVLSGDTIDYILNIRHKDGTNVVSGAVVEDDLSGIWEHIEAPATAGDLNAVASAGTVTLDADARKLVWTGDLAAGANVEVTFSVKVDAKASNVSLVNTVGTPDSEKRGECDTAIGCRTSHLIPEGTYTYAKTANHPGAPGQPGLVYSGDTITYTVAVSHSGGDRVFGAGIEDNLAEVLKHATLISGPVTDTNPGMTAPKATIVDNKLVWKGDLEKNQMVLIAYTVKVNASGAVELPNTVTAKDEHPNTNRHSCDTTVGCSTLHKVERGTYSFTKTATKLGETVNTGDHVTYTVTVQHTAGDRVLGATIVDDLTKVLNNATIIGAPTVASNDGNDAGIASYNEDTKQLHWTGNLERRQTVTITYTVNVDPRENGATLMNVVTTPDTERGQCSPAGSCTTTHTVPQGQYVYSKTADAPSGSTVKGDDIITYTLNVTHSAGDRVFSAEITDDLTVLAGKATYNDDAKATAGNVTVKDGKLMWTGNLDKGQNVTVTFSVTVTAPAQATLTNTVTSADPNTGRHSCDTEVGCQTTHTLEPKVSPKIDKPQSEPQGEDPQSEPQGEKPQSEPAPQPEKPQSEGPQSEGPQSEGQPAPKNDPKPSPKKAPKGGKFLAQTGASHAVVGFAAISLAAGAILLVARRRKES